MQQPRRRGTENVSDLGVLGIAGQVFEDSTQTIIQWFLRRPAEPELTESAFPRDRERFIDLRVAVQNERRELCGMIAGVLTFGDESRGEINDSSFGLGDVGIR
jgi:hypothetical protein